MTKCTNLVLALLFGFTLAAQNTDGFEDWEYEGEWEVPVGWEVNNTFEVYPCSVKEEEAFSGEYALRLRSFGPSFEGYASGLAQRKFYVTPIDALLALQVKVDSLLSGGFAAVRAYGKASNYLDPIGEWQIAELTDGFEHIEILLDEQRLPDSVLLVIESGTTPGPLGYDGYTEMVVDQLEFVINVSASQEPGRNRKARIFPVPAREQATVRFSGWQAGLEVQLELWDVNGRLVLQTRGTTPAFTFECGGLPRGVYGYRLKRNGSIIQADRIVLH
ncbi:MAG: T9SS type A sorting domain-containing protein [Lewinellaceae bacterium]|nr:T9SS type A sorting domain-containing protein [Lewinellaceae bacterium]